MNYIQGNLVAKEVKIGIVAARFNEFITSKLLSGAPGGPGRSPIGSDQGYPFLGS